MATYCRDVDTMVWTSERTITAFRVILSISHMPHIKNNDTATNTHNAVERILKLKTDQSIVRSRKKRRVKNVKCCAVCVCVYFGI